jgi:hypothetical protein
MRLEGKTDMQPETWLNPAFYELTQPIHSNRHIGITEDHLDTEVIKKFKFQNSYKKNNLK